MRLTDHGCAAAAPAVSSIDVIAAAAMDRLVARNGLVGRNGLRMVPSVGGLPDGTSGVEDGLGAGGRLDGVDRLPVVNGGAA